MAENYGLLDGLSEKIALLPTDLVFVAVVAYLVYEFRNYWNSNGEQTLEHGPAELTTIGVIGTFIGISIGLASFDVNDINGSVPTLLQGLKTAFLTSVLGIGAGLIIKRKNLRLLEVEATESTDDFTPQVFKTMFETHLQSQDGLIRSMEKVADELSGNKDDSVASLLTRIQSDINHNHKEAQKDMERFVKELAEQSTKGIIETLEEVIRDFNNKIGEQFGENFAKLEIAVGHLNDWQQENKEQLSFLTETFEQATSSIDSVAESLKSVEESSTAIPEFMTKLEFIIQENEQQLLGLTENLGSFAKMREKAEASIPVIDQHIIDSVEIMKDASERASGHYQVLLNDSRSMIDQFSTASKEFSGEFKTATQEGSQAIRTSLDGVANDVKLSSDKMVEGVRNTANEMKLDMQSVGQQMKHNIDGQVKEIFDQFTKTEMKLKDLLAKEWGQWDEAMQTEITRIIGILANQLTQVSGAFVNDYRSMLNQIDATMKNANDTIGGLNS